MKNLILATAVLATIGAASPALAQSAPAVALVCSPVSDSATSNATVQGTPVLCQPVNVAKLAATIRSIHDMMVRMHATQTQMQEMQQYLKAYNAELHYLDAPILGDAATGEY
jgi:Tfp pilus assembly protein FimV